MNSFIGLWLALCAVPYMMYLVAWVFESRRPGNGPNDAPVWRDQSKAFLPGDIALAFAVTCAAFMETDGTVWYRTGWWLLLSIAAGIVVFTIGRKVLYSPKDYTPAAWKSPSKRWHDFVMFFGFTVISVYLVLPKFLTGFSGDSKLLGIGTIVGMSIWLAGVRLDMVRGEVPNPRQHPSEWKPIWKKE